MAKKKREFSSMTDMMEFFRKTGAQGGRNRAANMTKAQRSESARKASAARWGVKAAAASAKVRSAKAKAKRKGD